MIEGSWEKIVAFAIGVLVLLGLISIAMQSNALAGIMPAFAKWFSAEEKQEGCEVSFPVMYKQRENAFKSLEFYKVAEICKLLKKCYEDEGWLDNDVLFPKGKPCTCTFAKYYPDMLSKIAAGKIKSKTGPSVEYSYPF